jgi:hypothetical protein
MGSADRLVEGALAVGEHGDRLLQRELLEVRRGAVGGVRVLVLVDLEQAEDPRLGGVLVGLVEDVAGLLARRRGQLVDGVADDVLLTGLGGPGCADDEGHGGSSVKTDGWLPGSR